MKYDGYIDFFSDLFGVRADGLLCCAGENTMDGIAAAEYGILCICGSGVHIYLPGRIHPACIYLDQSVGSRAGQEQRAEEEVCDGSNWGGNCREYPYLVFPEREFLLDHRFDFDKYGVPRIPCTSGDSSGKCHRHGLLYRTGDRVYSGLLLGNMQGAEKSAEAAVICLLFPAAYGRTDQQIFPDAAVI